MRCVSTRRCVVSGLSAASALLGLAGWASAEPVEIVFGAVGQFPSSVKSQVPGGIPGVTDARFTNFNNRMFRSPTNGKWVAVATTTATPTSADQVMLIGMGLSASVAAREGVTQINPGGPTAEFINFSGLSVPRIDDAGRWALSFRLAGGTASDERLGKWDGSTFLVFKNGDAIPAQPSAFFTGSFTSANITNLGAAGFLASSSDNPTVAGNYSAYGADGSVVVIDAATVPGGQTGGNQVWTALDGNQATSGFWQDATGTHYIALGRVGNDAATNRVAVVDNTVVVQAGVTLPGLASPVTSIADVWMESNGDWFAHGANVDGVNWLVRNRSVIAASGQPIFPGSGEVWLTSVNAFRDVRGDNRGNYVISGRTNNPAGTLVDDVLVLNSARVIARESDPVDLDNDGAFNDSLYIGAFQGVAGNDTLNTDGYYYFATRLKNSPTATGGFGTSPNNSSLARVRAVAPICMADFNNDGDVGTDSDIEAFFACLAGNCCARCGTADFNGDGDVGTDSDIESFFRVLAGGPC